MAEESINPLITPEKNESNSTKMDSNSAENPLSPSNEFSPLAALNGSYNIEDTTKTFSSNEKTHQAKTTKRRVPIYLRASTGSCHDICKYGKHAFEEKPREFLQKRISKSSPNQADSIKIISYSDNIHQEKRIKEMAIEPLRTTTSKISPNKVKSVNLSISGEKNKEKGVVKDEPSSDNTKKHSLSIKICPRTKSCSPKFLCSSPRRSDLLRNKTHLPNLSPAKKSSSISEIPEIIKREIYLPSGKDEAPVREGSSNDGKISGADKKTCDQSSSMKSKLIKVKPVIASGDSYSFETGQKMTSSMMLADKAFGTPSSVRSSTTRLSLGKTASSNAREAGRVKSSFSSSSPLKFRNGTRTSKGEDSEKILHVIKTVTEKNALNPKARRAGRLITASCPLNHRKGTEKSDGKDVCEKALHVIKTEVENHASSSSSSSINLSCAKFPSLSFHEEKDENEEIKDWGNESDESVSKKTVSIKIGDIRHSSSHEDAAADDEKIDYSNDEADELISDKIISADIENLQPQDTTPSLSSHEEDDDEEIYPSSASESSSHTKSLSLSSLEEINGEDDEFISDKMISMEINEVQSVKENRKNLKKSKSIVLDDKKNRLPVKLKFRRGTIIDLQPENNVPKRLRFRRARIGGNKVDAFAPDSKKSMETDNVKPTTPNMTLRKADSFIFENKRSMDSNPGNPSKPLRKSRSAVNEDKSRSPLHLSRREKTVDLQTGNKSPKRLKFTRGRVLRSEDGKSDLRKKTIKKAGDKNDTVGLELSSRKVVLKHPEVQSRKKGQVLLNNVIEETASKLVESRKSKVKALVGAFETVISLQETKPSSR